MGLCCTDHLALKCAVYITCSENQRAEVSAIIGSKGVCDICGGIAFFVVTYNPK